MSIEGPRNSDETLMEARMREARKRPQKKERGIGRKLPSFDTYADDQPILPSEPREPNPNIKRAPAKRESIPATHVRRSLGSDKPHYSPGNPLKEKKLAWQVRRKLNESSVAEKALGQAPAKIMKAETAERERRSKKKRENPLNLERTFDESAEEKAQKEALKLELLALKQEYDAQERSPNSLKEYKDKLRALLEKYAPQGDVSPASRVLAPETAPEPVENIAVDTPSVEASEQAAESNPQEKLYQLKAKYQLQPSSSPYAHSWSYEIPRTGASSEVPNQAGEPSSSPVDYDPNLHSPEAAARIYQTGEGYIPTETPKKVEFDPNLHSPEAAARMYQTGAYGEVPQEAAPESAPGIPTAEEAAESAPATPAEEKPIVMLNPVLMRQAGIKNVPNGFEPLPRRPGERIRKNPTKTPWQRKGLFGALGVGGIVAGLALLFHPTEKPQLKHQDTRTAAAPGAPRPETAPAAVRSKDAPPAVVVPARIPETSASIEKAGEGADLLYLKLLDRVMLDYPDGAQKPPLVEKLFSFKTAGEFSRHFKFEKLPNSAVMSQADSSHAADTLKITDNGKTLVYIDSNKQAHVLLETKPDGSIVEHQAEGLKMRPYRPRA